MYSLACQVGLFFVAVIAIAGAFTASCWVWLPPVVWVAGFVALVAALEYIALPLNRGSEDGLLYSQPRNQYPGKPEEKWFFINGYEIIPDWIMIAGIH